MTEQQGIPPIHFAVGRGDARLAYQIYGEGPFLVTIPPTAQNIEVAWEWPSIRAMFERFGSFTRHLLFDKRGTGASDRRSQMPGIDERVDDLRAVMDHAGIERAHLFGASEGGPMALLFAATYPDRVESIIINGSGARTFLDLTAEDRQVQEQRMRMACALWGTPDSPFVDAFAPSMAGDPEFRQWHQRYERLAASADSLLELLVANMDIDVREIVPTLDVPALVLHRTGDQVVPVELAREVTELLPNSQLIEHEGIDHFNYVGNTDEWLDEIERFITGRVTSAPVVTRSKIRPRIETLGRFCVVVDGADVPTSAWGSRLARQLCKRLVAARGWPVTRDELIDLLWPDEVDRAKAGARLSVQLSAVRRVLDGGVMADRQIVCLDLDEVDTDLEALLTAGDDQAIVDAYTGEFLPEDRYDDWTEGPRSEARVRFAAAARRLAAANGEEGRHAEAAELARKLIAANRYDEEAHAVLVRSLRAGGEVAEGRRAHAAWTEAMAEIDVEVQPFDELD